MQVTEALHHHEQIVLLRQQLMVLHMVDHLKAEFVLCCGLLSRFDTDRALFTLSGLNMAQTRKFDTIAHWVPLKVEHGVNGLDLYPPAALLESIANDGRVVPITNDKLVAIFNVRVLEWYLTHSSLEHVVISTFARLLKALLVGFLV